MTELMTTISFTMYYSMIDDTLDIENASENNKWKPIRMDSLLFDVTENELEKETLFLCRSLTSMLNKLTSDNCSKLITKIGNLPINSPIKMQKVVSVIHRKAINDDKYRIYYVKTCEFIREKSIVDENGISRTFSSFLEDKCIRYFEISFNEIVAFERQKYEINLIDCQDVKEISLRDVLENETKHYHQCVGNCYFIGELFKLKMIDRDALLQILDRLLKSKRNVAVESLCAILITIGEFYEKHFGDIPSVYFEKAKSAFDQQELPARIRFLLLDLIELKQNSWCPINRSVELFDTSFSLEIKSEPEVIEDPVPVTIANTCASEMVVQKQESYDIPSEKKPPMGKNQERNSSKPNVDLPLQFDLPFSRSDFVMTQKIRNDPRNNAMRRPNLISMRRKAWDPPCVKPYAYCYSKPYESTSVKGVPFPNVGYRSGHLNNRPFTPTPKLQRRNFNSRLWLSVAELIQKSRKRKLESPWNSSQNV